MSDNYNILITKLDAFIRKYYKNQIIRGIIYTVAVLLAFFLTVTFLEYLAQFGTTARTFIFYLYLFMGFSIIVRLIVMPLFKLYRIGKIISHKQAAEIIGNHFSDVQDRLLNTLQLKELSESTLNGNADLIWASIDQRSARLRPVPFSNAIDLKSNRKYLKFAVIPFTLVFIFLLISPRMITEPTNRIINHNVYFEKEAPFRFILLNETLDAVQQEDVSIRVKIEGETAPDAVYVNNRDNSFRMNKENNILFSYNFRNVQKDITFFFEADGVKSPEFRIHVLPKPIVLNFETELNYPDYTGNQDEVLENTGDLVVPEGTVIKWKFITRDTDKLDLILGDQLHELTRNNSNVFSFEERFLKTIRYSISTKNEFLKNKDSLAYSVHVIPDVYPIINVEEFVDSVFDNRLYFRGLIKDDYGFRNLNFTYGIQEKSSSEIDSLITEPIRIKTNSTQQQFFHFFDLSMLELKAGEVVEYYFEVWDNDGINGSKSSRSQKMIFKAPTLEEIEEKTDASNEKIKDDMEKAMKDLNLLQRDIDEAIKKMYDKKSLDWQDKQQLQDLLSRQKSIQERIENFQQENEDKLRNEQQYKEVDQDIIQKNEELKKLMDEILTEDMKKLIDEIQKLIDELDKDKVNEMMEEMKLSNEDLEKELDRNLELFKQLEFEQKLQETIDKLKQLAEKQEKLSEETQNSDKNASLEKDLKGQQDSLNSQFDEIRKEIDELEKKNSELEDPNQLENTDSEEQEIQDMMQESSDELQNQKNSKASQKQKGASQKMKQLSEKMQEMMEGMQMEQLGEDMNALREILENLIQVSFDQENLMNTLEETNVGDPKFEKLIDGQKNLKDDMQMIADSLFALSKRQMAIKSFVNKEVSNINENIIKALEAMADRIVSRKGKAIESQQYVMTSVNNLALLLGETLEQMMQQMMQMSGNGNSSCQKPGSSGGSGQLKSMQQLQQQLNDQLKQLRDGQKPGQKTGLGDQQMSEQLARLAAQQSAIRKQMEQYRDQLKEEGRGNDGNVAKMIEDMEKTERDIVNKKITQETIDRQQDILTRLLKSEKAERQREEDQKRESTEAKDIKVINPDVFFEYNKLKNREVELIKTVPPSLHPFYKTKVTEYFYRFD